MMLKQALRAVLVAVALLAALAGPFVSTAYADCGSAGSGTICPR